MMRQKCSISTEECLQRGEESRVLTDAWWLDPHLQWPLHQEPPGYLVICWKSWIASQRSKNILANYYLSETGLGVLCNDLANTAQNIGIRYYVTDTKKPRLRLSKVTWLNDTVRLLTQFSVTPKPSWNSSSTHIPPSHPTLPPAALSLLNPW